MVQIFIGGSVQEVKIVSDGILMDINGDVLYIGVDGNLMKKQVGGLVVVMLDGIFNGVNGYDVVDVKIIFGSGMIVDFIQVSNNVDIKGVMVFVEDMNIVLIGQVYIVVNGVQFYDVVVDGVVIVIIGGVIVNIGVEGELMIVVNKIVIEIYYEFVNGNILDDDGVVLYKVVDGFLIIEVIGKFEVIMDLLKVLDDVIVFVDKFCFFLGVVQNCLDFVVINLNNIIINLFEVQFCIQDVDYVIEVFNMLKVQIIQQVGNFVLVKVNQVLQQVLFLLQG